MPEHQLQKGDLYNPAFDPDRFQFEAFLRIRGVLKGSGIVRIESKGGRYVVVDLSKRNKGRLGIIIESNLPQYFPFPKENS